MARASLLPTVFVMVKAPVAGAVKTRLAKRIGASEALRFYRSATAALLRRLSGDPRWRTVLAVTPDIQAQGSFWPARIDRRPQGRGDLGERMHRLLCAGRGAPVIVIGSDIPDIRSVDIADAIGVARRAGLVFGPAEDGGFWLVGCRRRPGPARLFRAVRWSSEHALGDCLTNAKGDVGFVRILSDVDTEADWLRWRRCYGSGRIG